MGDLKPLAVTGSLLPEFLATNLHYIESIVIHQGDFISWTWPPVPIEIFFLDLAKSWPLNNHAVKNYFPCLIPNHSILIHQDYIHFNEYWIHLTMEYYKNYFEYLGSMYGGTAYYRCIKQFGNNDFVDLQQLPYDKKMALLETARESADPLVQQVMRSAAAKCAIENGMFDDAQALLDAVDPTVPASHSTLKVGGIAKSNHEVVSRMLEQYRANAGKG